MGWGMRSETFGSVLAHAIGGGWGKEEPFTGGKRVAVIRGTDFSNIESLNFDAVPRRYEDAKKAERRKLRDGDIVLEISGGSRSSSQSTGRSLLITDAILDNFDCDVIPASFCRLVRVDPQLVDPRYAFYHLQEMYQSRRATEYEHQSTGISNFQFTYFLETERINLPPLPEQRAIAEMLGSLDDKIGLNRRMNGTLESMARTLFKSWFVDFDPVHANAAGEPLLPADLAALFPAEFEPSVLGDIPNGWEVRSLDAIAEYLNGLALQKYPAESEMPTLPRLKIAQLRKGDTKGAERSNTDVPEKYIVKDGDVIFSWSGSLLVRLWTGGKAALNQHLFKVTSEEFSRWFYYLWTEHHLDDFQATAASKATTMGHIKRHHLSDAQVIVPPQDTLNAVGEIIAPLHEQIITNDLQSRTLSDLRDSLLPLLLSGELRAPDVEGREVDGVGA